MWPRKGTEAFPPSDLLFQLCRKAYQKIPANLYLILEPGIEFVVSKLLQEEHALNLRSI